jgi:hypothetical protein
MGRCGWEQIIEKKQAARSAALKEIIFIGI